VKWQFIVAELVWHGHHQDSYLMTVPQPSHCLHTQLFYELRVCWQCRWLLVKGAWKHQSTGACKAFIYLLVPQHSYSSTPRAICPGRWIISEHNHEEMDCQFQSSTSIGVLN
jgi:hypothetical protein